MFQLKCNACGAMYWRAGNHEPDTNATNITDQRGDSCPECGRDGWQIVSEEHPQEDES
jgi:predicted  nucleic acid-binding Zn-ribbon protein